MLSSAGKFLSVLNITARKGLHTFYCRPQFLHGCTSEKPGVYPMLVNLIIFSYILWGFLFYGANTPKMSLLSLLSDSCQNLNCSYKDHKDIPSSISCK